MDSCGVSLGLSLDVLIVNQNQEIEGLMFKFRGACIYT